MDAAALKRAASAVVIGAGGLLWLAAILFMAQTAQNSDQFSRLHPWILAINIAIIISKKADMIHNRALTLQSCTMRFQPACCSNRTRIHQFAGSRKMRHKYQLNPIFV